MRDKKVWGAMWRMVNRAEWAKTWGVCTGTKQFKAPGFGRHRQGFHCNTILLEKVKMGGIIQNPSTDLVASKKIRHRSHIIATSVKLSPRNRLGRDVFTIKLCIAGVQYHLHNVFSIEPAHA